MLTASSLTPARLLLASKKPTCSCRFTQSPRSFGRCLDNRYSTCSDPSSLLDHRLGEQPVPSSSSSSMSIRKKSSRLRDRAGVPVYPDPRGAFRHQELDPSDSSQSLDGPIFQPAKPWTMRARTQAERSQMSHRERLIALDLLQDLSVPLEELEHTSDTDPDQAGQNSFFESPHFQTILSEHSKRKTLARHRPVEMSEEDTRREDILKEVTDDQIAIIDWFETDHELLRWIDSRFFLDEHGAVSDSSTATINAQSVEAKLGEAFGSHIASDGDDIDLGFDCKDPSELLKRPLCLTPLLSPILRHLLKTFSSRFRNPHISLYLFVSIQSHPDPVVKYLGLTKEVYQEMMRIRWDHWRDFEGIRDDMVSMRRMGVEMDEAVKRLVEEVTQAVVRDELAAERRALISARQQDQPCSLTEADLKPFRRISGTQRAAVVDMEAIINEHIESENRSFARRLRIPTGSPSPIHH